MCRSTYSLLSLIITEVLESSIDHKHRVIDWHNSEELTWERERERERKTGDAWFVSPSVRFPLSSMKEWRNIKVTPSLQVPARLSFSFTQNDEGIHWAIRRYLLSWLIRKTPSCVRSQKQSGEKRSSHSLPEMFRLLCLFTWIRWPTVEIALVSFPLPLIMWPINRSNQWRIQDFLSTGQTPSRNFLITGQ